MNTPKFQMRKMQRQMIKERDYRDGLERELACKVALIAQKGTATSREKIPAVNLSAHSWTRQLPVCVNICVVAVSVQRLTSISCSIGWRS